MSEKDISNNELAVLIRESAEQTKSDLVVLIKVNGEQIESLARMTKESFDEMGERFDRLEARVASLELRIVTLEEDVRIIKNEVFNLKLRLSSMAPTFEIEALQRRVTKIEVKIQQEERNRMQRIGKNK